MIFTSYFIRTSMYICLQQEVMFVSLFVSYRGVRFCLDDIKDWKTEWIIKNNTGLFNDIHFIFYKDIYVYLLAIGSYVCFSVCLSVIGVFHWGRCVGN